MSAKGQYADIGDGVDDVAMFDRPPAVGCHQSMGSGSKCYSTATTRVFPNRCGFRVTVKRSWRVYGATTGLGGSDLGFPMKRLLLTIVSFSFLGFDPRHWPRISRGRHLRPLRRRL